MNILLLTLDLAFSSLIAKGSCVSSSIIQPSPTTTVISSTSAIANTLPPIPGPPTKLPVPTPSTAAPPTASPLPTKCIYYINITLARYPWKAIWDKDFGQTFAFIKSLPAKIMSIFKDGNLSDCKSVYLATTEISSMYSNDQNKLRVHLMANFSAAMNNSQEPETFLMAQNATGALGNLTFDRIVVKKTLISGAVLGDWVGGNCATCCGDQFYQNRTCIPEKDCGGVILNRTIPCERKCQLNCGTVRMFTFSVSLMEYNWKNDYINTQSAAYKDLYGTLTKGNDSFLYEVQKMFSDVLLTTAYKYTKNDISLEKDGELVNVSFTVVFGKPPSKPNDPEAIFRFETENGKLGKFSIDVKKIKVKEETLGYTFTEWKTVKDGCSTCCGTGGEVTQTRKCTARVGECTSAQVERKIRCKHVCTNGECSAGSKASTSCLLAVLLALVSLFWYMT